MTTAEITSAGAYVPSTAARTRRGQVPVCNGDEDAITLAVSAGLDCLSQVDVHPIGQVFVALGSAPISLGSPGEVLREALGLDESVPVALTTGDPLGGAAALQAAFDAVATGRMTCALVIAAEAGDSKTVAAGAFAFLVEGGDGRGIQVSPSSSVGGVVSAMSLDASGRPQTSDLRYVETQLASTLEVLLPGQGATLDRVVLAGSHPTVARTLMPDTQVRYVGDLGVASMLLAVVEAARIADGRPVSTLVLTPARSALVTVTSPRLAPGALPEVVLEGDGRSERVEVPTSPILSLPTSSPFFARSAGELLRLEAAECTDCGHLAFPPSQRPICSRCHGTSWQPHPMPRFGTVFTYTVNRFLPTGFGAEMVMILGELADGSHYWAPGSGLDPAAVTIGMPVALVVRRFTDAGGIPTYAMKFSHPVERYDEPVRAAIRESERV